MARSPATADIGGTIEHVLLLGHLMTVRATEECETSTTRPEPHQAFHIIDPEGNEDTLCAYDVRRVDVPMSQASGHGVGS
jgi:hypothetical protein